MVQPPSLVMPLHCMIAGAIHTSLSISLTVERHAGSMIRLWNQQYEFMDPSCILSTVQTGVGGGVLAFLAHIGLVWANQSLPKCQY